MTMPSSPNRVAPKNLGQPGEWGWPPLSSAMKSRILVGVEVSKGHCCSISFSLDY
jgi:hypothetical protein